MRLHLAIAFTSLCLFSGIAKAENLNLQEKPETTSVYLSPYAYGPGLGGLFALNDTLKAQSKAFMKLSFSQNWRLQEHLDLGLDLDWWLPGSNLGGLLNVNYVFGGEGFRPFIGAGLGFMHIDNPSYNSWGNGFGIAGEAILGAFIDLSDNTHLRIRVPFEIVGDSQMDRIAGLDIAVLFSLPTYGTKVKKLKY